MSSLISIIALGALTLFVMLLPLWQRRADRSLGTGLETNSLSIQWENEKDRLVKEQHDLDLALAEGKISEETHAVEREQVVYDAKRALERLRLARSESEKRTAKAKHKPRSYPLWGMGFAASILVASIGLVFHLDGQDVQRELSQAEASKAPTQPDIQKMVASLEERVKSGGSSLKEQLMLARSFLVLGRRNESISLYKGIAKANGDNVPALMALGEIHFNSKAPEEQSQALLYFEKALVVEPDKPEALWYKSLALLRDKKFDQSRTVLVKLKEIAKDNPKAIEAVSQLLTELDKNRAKAQKNNPPQ